MQEVKANLEAFYQFLAKVSNDRYPLPVIQESYEISPYPDNLLH
ncbi:hypothetical protein [Leptolyngbya sp. DQ-M1]